ncbi:MAG: RDD family protein [Euryarchaeota archaeon]|nr:RDD family protein [Euryarchaeota archaeon]
MEEASATKRLAAYLLDIAAVTGASVSYFAVSIAFPVYTPVKFAITPSYILTILLTLWVYLTIFENEGGQTLGKIVLDIKVVGNITLQKSAIRNFPKAFILPLIIDIILGKRHNSLRFIDRYTKITVIEL